jgi:alpha-1,3/alpha-1,6-mannosyltransferase
VGFKCGLSSSAVDEVKGRNRPTLISLNRFEKKKNTALAIEAFALLRSKLSKESSATHLRTLRLVLAGMLPRYTCFHILTIAASGGYDPRLEDNLMTLASLVDIAKRHGLTYSMCTPSSSQVALPGFNASSTSTPDVVFLLNFATSQRSALLSSPNTLALLYTPANEHFGIVPIEAMVSGLPVLAANSGGPTESVLDPESPGAEAGVARTGWLREPDAKIWAQALEEIVALSSKERAEIGTRAKYRAEKLFSMDSMAQNFEGAIKTAVDMGAVPRLPMIIPILAVAALALAIFVAVNSL